MTTVDATMENVSSFLDDSVAAKAAAEQEFNAAIEAAGLKVTATGEFETAGDDKVTADFDPNPGDDKVTADFDPNPGDGKVTADFDPNPGDGKVTADFDPNPGDGKVTADFDPNPGDGKVTADFDPNPGDGKVAADFDPNPGNGKVTADFDPNAQAQAAATAEADRQAAAQAQQPDPEVARLQRENIQFRMQQEQARFAQAVQDRVSKEYNTLIQQGVDEETAQAAARRIRDLAIGSANEVLLERNIRRATFAAAKQHNLTID